METTIRVDLLLKLAEHLESGELGHAHFSYAHFNSLHAVGDVYMENGCGTCGCAIGECPFVFPEDWNFQYQLPFLRNHENVTGTVGEAVCVYFGVTYNQYRWLFSPSMISCDNGQLDSDATKEEVAAHIRAFCDLHGNSISKL